MKESNNFDEVLDEINSALKDPNGIVKHQKRLAFCLSLGLVELLEEYLTKHQVLKKGYKINHQWLKKKKDNVKEILLDKVSSLEELDKLDMLLDAAYKIESKRNDLAYGGPVPEEILKELINEFLEIKKKVENE